MIFFNIILNNTSPDPPTVINLIMSTLFEKCGGVIFMFVGNMLHERFPFGCDHLLKALLGGCCTPVQMVADSFYPVCYLLTALLFAQLQHLLSNGSSNVPDVKEMGTTRLAFTYPLGNAPVAIRYEDYNLYFIFYSFHTIFIYCNLYIYIIFIYLFYLFIFKFNVGVIAVLDCI